MKSENLGKITFFLAVLLCCLCGMPLAGQDIEDLLDGANTSKNQETEMPPAIEEIKADYAPPTTENAEWYAGYISFLAGMAGAGPGGVIPGTMVGGTAKNLIHLEKVATMMNELAKNPSEQQVADLKQKILDEFGINILDGPLKLAKVEGGEGYNQDTSYWKPSAWTPEQLKGVYNTLDALPKKFRSYTKKIVKLQDNQGEFPVFDHDKDNKLITDKNGNPVVIGTKLGSRETCGVVYRACPDTVHLFDKNTMGSYAKPEDGIAKLRMTMVHEMTHCWQFQDDSILTKWQKTFWRRILNFWPVKNRGEELGNCPPPRTNDALLPFETLTKNKTWEIGVTVSCYGGFLSRMSDQPVNVGAEDQAEAVALAACAPKRMKGFVLRKEAVEDDILDYSITEGWLTNSALPEIEYNPRWFGYCQNARLKTNPVPSGRKYLAMPVLPPVFVEANGETKGMSNTNVSSEEVYLYKYLTVKPYQ